MKTSFHILVCLIINTLFIACDHTPDYILKEKQMEDLLVDIHKSEALIETEYEKFNTSEKKARGALATRAGTTIGRGMLALVMTTR